MIIFAVSLRASEVGCFWGGRWDGGYGKGFGAEQRKRFWSRAKKGEERRGKQKETEKEEGGRESCAREETSR